MKFGHMDLFFTNNFSLCFVHVQGEALFQTHENLEHLAMMERVLGPLPQHMIMSSEYDWFLVVHYVFFYQVEGSYNDLQ